MRRIGLALAVALTLVASTGFAAVELGGKRALDVGTGAVDVVATPDGQKIYVLTQSGELKILNGAGKLNGSVSVGEGYTSVQPMGRGQQVMLFGPKVGATVVSLDFIQTIDVAGLAVRGKPDAPVTIAVFSDFQ